MTTVPRISVVPSVVSKKVGDETVLLDFDAGVYYGLDPVGTRIWELLAEQHSTSEIVDMMLAEYEVTRELLERDVLALVDDLAAHGLITETES